MHRFTVNARAAQASRGPQTRRLTHAVNVVEYGLLAMVLITMVSTGATFVGHKLDGVFVTVADAMGQAVKPQTALAFGQRTNRKGAPVERKASGPFYAIVSSPLF